MKFVDWFVLREAEEIDRQQIEDELKEILEKLGEKYSPHPIIGYSIEDLMYILRRKRAQLERFERDKEYYQQKQLAEPTPPMQLPIPTDVDPKRKALQSDRSWKGNKDHKSSYRWWDRTE